MPLDNTTNMPDDPFDKFNTAQSPILFPVAERRLGWEQRAGGFERFNSHKAIIRVTPNGEAVHVLGVVGDGYKLVHNKELYGHVEDTLRKEIQPQHLHGVIVHDRVAGWGRTCFREYQFPNIKCVLLSGARSDIAFRMIVQNGYGGSALRIHAGAIDFYCTNGMIRGEHQAAYRKHTSRLFVGDMVSTVKTALDTFATSQQVWQRWAQTPIRHQVAMDLFRDLASSDKLRENLQAQYLRERDVRGDNLWSIYSAMTYYASHADGDFKLRSSVNEQDTVASTMLQRELNVARWVETPTWKKLEAVT